MSAAQHPKSTLPCTPELRRKIKLEAAKRNITMTRLVERAVKRELEENDKDQP